MNGIWIKSSISPLLILDQYVQHVLHTTNNYYNEINYSISCVCLQWRLTQFTQVAVGSPVQAAPLRSPGPHLQ